MALYGTTDQKLEATPKRLVKVQVNILCMPPPLEMVLEKNTEDKVNNI